MSTINYDEILPAAETEQEKWVRAGAILPLSQCENQCHWNGWCGREQRNGRGSTYNVEVGKEAEAVIRCHCFADLGANRGGTTDCSGSAGGTESWSCPLDCNKKCVSLSTSRMNSKSDVIFPGYFHPKIFFTYRYLQQECMVLNEYIFK